MNPNFFIVIFLFILFGCKSSFTLEKYNSKELLISSIEIQQKEDHLPGLSFIAGKGDLILFEVHSGTANFAQNVITLLLHLRDTPIIAVALLLAKIYLITGHYKKYL